MAQDYPYTRLWSPEKGEGATRPELVRGSLKIRKDAGGQFEAECRFNVGGRHLSAVGAGFEPPEALEQMYQMAEAEYLRHTQEA